MIKKPMDDDEANKGWMPLGNTSHRRGQFLDVGSFGSKSEKQAPCARERLGLIRV